VKHSTRPDAVQLRNAFARVLVLNASRRDYFQIASQVKHSTRLDAFKIKF
jgi:hypothetical protein